MIELLVLRPVESLFYCLPIMIIKPVRKNRSRRRLTVEKLECRSLMAGMPGFHNISMPMDVDNDLRISPLDALVVINRINSSVGIDGEDAADKPVTFCDVDADGTVSPLDVLAVVNELNANFAMPIPAGEPPEAIPDPFISGPIITENDVTCLLKRASMATSSNDAIIAIVDRSGRILGVRTESDVDAMYTGREADLVFAIDGAVAKARTAAFFSNEEAPLTSRTIRFISQSTITQREVESNPDIADPESPLRGPGFVAPIGTGAHFPPVVANTPPVDLFAIEHQSRDSSVHPGLDGIKGTPDDENMSWRFDANPAFIAEDAKSFLKTFPESYGVQAGLLLNANKVSTAQGRGIATLPGGMPLYKKRDDGTLALVGGIGVFFPGPNGFATYEQNFVHASLRGAAGPQTNSERLNAPKVLESEFIAYFAAGGTVVGPGATPVTEFEGSAPSCGFGMPSGRIDLVGITLEIFGPHPTRENAVTGARRLLQVGRANQGGHGLNTGTDQPINIGGMKAQSGQSVPEGWLIKPHGSTVDPQFTAAEVERIINNGIQEANLTRAAIRLDLKNGFRPGARTKMVLAVSDSAGEVLGLYRMHDATLFSIDVAVAKSRNTAYYAGNSLVAADRIDQDNNGSFDIPIGTALTNRTFRFLALPRFPSGSPQGTPAGDFSILTMPGINSLSGENTGAALPASVYASTTATVLSFDSFNASRNFRDPRNIKRQNGIVFFPGSSALYDDVSGTKVLVGGLGVSGDGVDQDDVVTVGAQQGFAAPDALRSDQFLVAGVRLPYQNFNRNPRG